MSELKDLEMLVPPILSGFWEKELELSFYFLIFLKDGLAPICPPFYSKTE
jgi:hypothetical protein